VTAASLTSVGLMDVRSPLEILPPALATVRKLTVVLRHTAAQILAAAPGEYHWRPLFFTPFLTTASSIKRRSAFAAHLKKHGIDPTTVDLESFAPPLRPVPLPKSRRSIQIIKVEPIKVESPKMSLAEEFKELFTGFKDGTYLSFAYHHF